MLIVYIDCLDAPYRVRGIRRHYPAETLESALTGGAESPQESFDHQHNSSYEG
jgi:hypothetical protein